MVEFINDNTNTVTRTEKLSGFSEIPCACGERKRATCTSPNCKNMKKELE